MPTFYKDKIVCHQCWSKSALGEEVSAWLQVTFTAEYSIDNSGWLANILIDKPLAPQMDAARALQAQITAAHEKRLARIKISNKIARVPANERIRDAEITAFRLAREQEEKEQARLQCEREEEKDGAICSIQGGLGAGNN